ncbi:MAG: type IV pilus biogenesis/stability protein PilW [Gammaproteobacteria bacterium]|nr:type IV pilus biogenesis/stability protein PilW [Gammaproteobacteria bacterium]
MSRSTWIVVLILSLSACQSSPPSNKAESAEDRTKLAAINTQLAIEYMRDGENELALRKLEKAIEAEPKSVDAHNTMALLHARLGENKEAEESFKKALSLDPVNWSALNNYGQFLCQQQRFEEGQTQFTAALKNPLNRAPENALANAGTCAMQAKDSATAEQRFREALQINAQFAPALLPLARLSFEQANFLQARAYYQRYLAVAPQSARTLWLGIRIENALDERDLMSSYVMILKNKFPDSPEYGWFQQGKFD